MRTGARGQDPAMSTSRTDEPDDTRLYECLAYIGQVWTDMRPPRLR